MCVHRNAPPPFSPPPHPPLLTLLPSNRKVVLPKTSGTSSGPTPPSNPDSNAASTAVVLVAIVIIVAVVAGGCLFVLCKNRQRIEGNLMCAAALMCGVGCLVTACYQCLCTHTEVATMLCCGQMSYKVTGCCAGVLNAFYGHQLLHTVLQLHHTGLL